MPLDPVDPFEGVDPTYVFGYRERLIEWMKADLAAHPFEDLAHRAAIISVFAGIVAQTIGSSHATRAGVLRALGMTHDQITRLAVRAFDKLNGAGVPGVKETKQ